MNLMLPDMALVKRLRSDADFRALIAWLELEVERQRDTNDYQSNTTLLHQGQGRAQFGKELVAIFKQQ